MTNQEDGETTLDCSENEYFVEGFDPKQVNSSEKIPDMSSDESDSADELEDTSDGPTHTACPLCPKVMELKCIKAHLKSHLGVLIILLFGTIVM